MCLTNEIEVNSVTKRVHQLVNSKTNAKVANLNKFVKTKTIGYLRVLEKSKLLDKQESEALKAYELDGCSYASQ